MKKKPETRQKKSRGGSFLRPFPRTIKRAEGAIWRELSENERPVQPSMRFQTKDKLGGGAQKPASGSKDASEPKRLRLLIPFYFSTNCPDEMVGALKGPNCLKNVHGKSQ